MTSPLVLHGYAYSVYTRAVRMAGLAKKMTVDIREIDPFDPEMRRFNPHPFGRVPVLAHGSFQLYETRAILEYLEALAPTPSLVPADPQSAARMRQVMGIADSYVYGPLVRQVVSQALFALLDGATPDQLVITEGLQNAATAMKVLEEIAIEGKVLNGQSLSLADCLLWPMLDYFRQVPESAESWAQCRALERWAAGMAEHPVAVQTAPDLGGYTA